MEPPDSVSLNFMRLPGMVSPCLIMDVGKTGSDAYAGGVPLDRELQSDLADGWMLPGDEKTDALEQQTIATASDDASPQTKSLSRWDQHLKSVSHGVPVSILAVAPVDRLYSGVLAPGCTLREFLQALRSSQGAFLHKWNGHILLLNYGTWFLDADQYPSWKVVKILRKLNTPPVALPDLCAAAT